MNNDNYRAEYYKIKMIEPLKKTTREYRENLLKKLKIVKRIIKREHLKSRVEKTINLLESSLNRSQKLSNP